MLDSNFESKQGNTRCVRHSTGSLKRHSKKHGAPPLKTMSRSMAPLTKKRRTRRMRCFFKACIAGLFKFKVLRHISDTITN